MNDPPMALDRATTQVEGMIERGETFGRVEDAIERARLSQDHKAALWLLAWSLRDPAAQREDARVMAAAFATSAGRRRKPHLVSDSGPDERGLGLELDVTLHDNAPIGG